MDSRLAQVVKKAQTAEQQFDQALTSSGSPLENTITLLQEYRIATDQVLECDFLYSRSTNVETRLWSAHSRLNARLRKQLSKLRKERSNKPVESRKHTKIYLTFLKDSLRFYREHIQKLNARFGGIVELQRIARQVKSETVDLSSQNPISPEVQAQALLSCHQTLIYLGDLFRYRAAEKLDKVPDWGPAIGYYALAITLRPSSGLAFHQQSVVAFEQGDYLRSTYYLYRAIVVDEPHPNATANLELQFKKIASGWEKGELVPKNLPNDRSASRKALVAWFIRLQSMCYKGQQFSQFEELEMEVLSRVGSEMKARSLDGILPKMVFINFAAQATAASQLQSKPDSTECWQSYFFFLRVNVNFFFTLLEILRKDLENQLGQDQGPSTDQTLTRNLSDQACHVLPCLRLYSTWLLSNAQIVAAPVYDEGITQTINQFWAMYAATLSVIATAFPFRELPEVSYQLEEDVDAFGFKPLDSDKTQKLWHSPGQPKPKFSDPGLSRLDPKVEMLARVRELLMDGLLLAAVEKDVPVNFDGVRFVVEDRSAAIPNNLTQETRTHDVQSQQIQTAQSAPQYHQSSMVTAALSRAQDITTAPPKPQTRETELMNMVDDLVGPEDDEDEGLPPTPPVQSMDSNHQFSTEISGHYGARNGSFAKSTSPRGILPTGTPELRPSAGAWQSSTSPLGRSSQRLQSVSSIWNDPLLHNTSPMTPNQIAGGPPSRISSNASINMTNGHSRVNSGASIRSSLPNQNGWASFEPTPQVLPVGYGRHDRLASFQGQDSYGQYSGMNSPLLFGAGPSPWNTAPRKSLPGLGTTPPNGQVG